MAYHLIYTMPDGSVVSEEKEFDSFFDAEDWLEQIGAVYWEIGILEGGRIK